MRIYSEAGKYGDNWVVLADWHGTERVVFSSYSVWACLDWVKREEAKTAW